MKKIYMMVAVFSVLTCLSAESWFSTQLTIADSTGDHSNSRVTLSDSRGNRIIVKSNAPLTQSQAGLVEKTVQTVTGWENVQYELIKFSFTTDFIEVIALPDTLTVQGRDIMKNIPSGMIFYLKPQLEYDFRINSGDFFLRIKGTYINKNELFNKLDDAIKNPENYIERHDPEYYLAKINKLTVTSERNTKELDMIKRVLVNKESFFVKVPDLVIDGVIDVKSKNISASPDEVMKELTVARSMKVSKAQILAVLKIYFGEK